MPPMINTKAIAPINIVRRDHRSFAVSLDVTLPDSVSRLSRFKSALSSAADWQRNIAIFFQSLVDDLLEPRRNIRIQPNCRGWRSIQNGFEDHTARAASKRKHAPAHIS